MAELQVQEIVTLDSTDVQEDIQVESEPAPKKWAAPTELVTALRRRFKKSIEPSEIPAATVASASKTKVPQNGEGSLHFESYTFLSQDTFAISCLLSHSFVARSKSVLSELV